MNKARRKALDSIIEEMESLKEGLQDIADAEQDVCDSLGGHFEWTERYTQVENNVELLNNAVDSLEDLIDLVKEVV